MPTRGNKGRSHGQDDLPAQRVSPTLHYYYYMFCQISVFEFLLTSKTKTQKREKLFRERKTFRERKLMPPLMSAVA